MLFYTDGACINQGREDRLVQAGYAFACFHNNEMLKKDSGKVPGEQDSFRAELYAILKALEFYNDNAEEGEKCIIKTDSLMAVNYFLGVNLRVKHRDMWDKIEPLCVKHYPLVKISHVKGHSDDGRNRLVDSYAKIAARRLVM